MKKLFLFTLFAIALITAISSASAYHYVNHMYGDYYYSNTVSKDYDSFSERTVVRTPYTYTLNYQKVDYGHYSKRYEGYNPYQVHIMHPYAYSGHNHKIIRLGGGYSYPGYSNNYAGYNNKLGHYMQHGYDGPEYYSYNVHRSY